MTRAAYGEDGQEYPGEWALYRANTARMLRGKAGRALLLELRAHLEAMPLHRLIEHKLADGGDVCTVGALIVGRSPGAFDAVARDMAEKARQEDQCADCMCKRSDHDSSGKCLVCERNAAETIAEWDAEGTPSEHRWRVGCDGFEEHGTDWEEDSAGAYLTVDEAVKTGVNRRLAWRLMALNDEDLGGLSPEERWRRVVRWIDDTLSEPESTVIAREVADVVGIEA